MKPVINSEGLNDCFQLYRVFISNSMAPFSYAKKRIVKPHQRCSDPTLGFLSLIVMYFSRKKDSWRKIKTENRQFYFFMILQSSRGNFLTKKIGDQNISFATEGDIGFL